VTGGRVDWLWCRGTLLATGSARQEVSTMALTRAGLPVLYDAIEARFT
jgi:hypothetical protein